MDMTNLLPEILRICAAMLAGGLIGLEREFRDKSAGWRGSSLCLPNRA
jgi:uncharacterized membrane protein YhiD involved in acid resistance